MFKSFTVYKVGNYDLGIEEIENRMKNNLFQECTKDQSQSVGWVEPVATGNDILTVNANGATLFTLKTEDRKVNSAALKNELEAAIRKEEEVRKASGAENPRLSKIEKGDLKDQIHDRMLRELPKSMSKYSYHNAYYDSLSKLLIVEGTSLTKADVMTAHFRDVTDAKTLLVQTKYEMCEIMSEWLQNSTTIDAEKGIMAGESCTLRDELEKRTTISYKNQDLDDNHLRGHLGEGFVVSAMELNFIDKYSLTITEEFVVKGIKLDSEMKMELAAELNEIDDENYQITAFHTDFNYMANTFREMIPMLEELFGGFENESGSAVAALE